MLASCHLSQYNFDMRLSHLFIVLLINTLGCAQPQAVDTLTGRVIKVADGDTITVLADGQKVRVRLHGIDCPERKQPFGTKAKQFTSDLVFDKVVTVIHRTTDQYGRVVGTVLLDDGRVLNDELVMAGLAWWFRKYAPKDEQLATLEAEAEREKRGLWVEPDPIPPWEWRKQRREKGALRIL